MRLKRLKLQGFKSFARSTTLEFPGQVSAIVGPNGTGKSNIAEAIRWVLGEQSLKSLRGKRGEDLIFHGSGKRARMSKARVELTFENIDKKIIDFDEVRIARVVYRDGVNEYFINDSKVRLKDVVELILKLGLSRSAHNIISQGESDRVLHMSPYERRNIVEHALGLEIYHFRKSEAEKKLTQTQENLRESQLLRREFSPHLKFLEDQTKKARQSSVFREKLQESVVEYVGKMSSQIVKEEAKYKTSSRPLVDEREKLESEIINLQNQLSEYDEQIERSKGPDFSMLSEIEVRIRNLSLELGKLEAQFQSYGSVPTSAVVDGSKTMKLIESLKSAISAALEKRELNFMVETLERINQQLEDFVGKDMRDENVFDRDKLLKQKGDLERELQELEVRKKKIQQEFSDSHTETIESQQKTKTLRGELDVKHKKLGETKDKLSALQFEMQKINLKKQELGYVKNEYAGILLKQENGVPSEEEDFDEMVQKNLLREIEKLKIKIEEAGGIDESVIKEYEEMSERDIFLSTQIEDLQQALKKTKKLVQDLEVQLDQEFKNGLETINNEFQKLFSTLFEGANASLKLEQGEEDEISGLFIKISIPRKRIRSINTLSGGERALTSVALLFALSQVNPPPFLVLDEVDAALDESNSARFGKLLQGLASHTQLVVITHNRETMRHATALYGVTMGSDGTSKLLSVKFEQAEELAQK